MGTPSPGHGWGDELARADRWALVRRICGSRLPAADVEDAVQETFLQLVKTDRSHINNIDAWLIVVALRACLRIHRTRYRRSEVPFEEVHDVLEDPAFGHVLDMEWFRLVCRYLSESERIVLDGLYIRPRPHADVARDLGVTRSHLRVIAYRARRRARTAMRSIGGREHVE